MPLLNPLGDSKIKLEQEAIPGGPDAMGKGFFTWQRRLLLTLLDSNLILEFDFRWGRGPSSSSLACA